MDQKRISLSGLTLSKISDPALAFQLNQMIKLKKEKAKGDLVARPISSDLTTGNETGPIRTLIKIPNSSALAFKLDQIRKSNKNRDKNKANNGLVPRAALVSLKPDQIRQVEAKMADQDKAMEPCCSKTLINEATDLDSRPSVVSPTTQVLLKPAKANVANRTKEDMEPCCSKTLLNEATDLICRPTAFDSFKMNQIRKFKDKVGDSTTAFDSSSSSTLIKKRKSNKVPKIYRSTKRVTTSLTTSSDPVVTRPALIDNSDSALPTQSSLYQTESNEIECTCTCMCTNCKKSLNNKQMEIDEQKMGKFLFLFSFLLLFFFFWFLFNI